ncbi:MAG: class E sortase [Acidimicrobiales bacterium]
MDGLISFLRSHPGARRGLSVLSALLLVGAAALLGYPVYTNFQHDRLQGRLGNELASSRLQQAYRDRKVGVGDALTRIRIPAIGVDTVVVEGTTTTALRAGAGHYPKTAMPCENGNMGIAGHRTTYGKPFANIDQLKAGDTISLETPVGRCDYEVEPAPKPFLSPAGRGAAFVVAPNDLRVIDQDPAKAELTLTTCHPKGSAKERLIIRARKVAGKAGSG